MVQAVVGSIVRGAAPTLAGTWSCDLESEALTWCDGVRAIFGMPFGASPDRATSLQCYDPASRSRLEVVRSNAIRMRRPFTLDVSLRTFGGEPRWMRIVGAMASDPGSRPRLYGIKQDITAEQAGWDRRRRCPGNDTLTGLAARDMFHEALMAGADKFTPGAAVILVSLDLAGSADTEGEILLRECAKRLCASFPNARSVARVDGGRFAILLNRRLSSPELDSLLVRASMALRRPVLSDGDWLRCRMSIGSALHPAAARYDPVGLLARAETSLMEDHADGLRRPDRIATGRNVAPGSGREADILL